MSLTDADRIAQLTAELAEARKSIEAAGAYERELSRKVCVARAERDVARAERDAAQAEAAAMRDALEDLFETYRGAGEESADLVVAYETFKANGAGRALAARVPLLEAVAKAAERIAGPRLPSAGDWDMLRLRLAALADQ